MLFNLSIENVALIKKADINFSEGFSVLTGETGAGKSILIGSVNMLLGERCGKDIIRHNEPYAYVEGLFYVDENIKSELSELDIEPDEDNSLIVSRKLMADGKNICKVGGKTVTVAVLRDIGRNLINVHGQHDNQALLDAKCHISFLDAFCDKGNSALYDKYSEIYEELVNCERELNKFDIDENEKLRKIDILEFEIEEITNANIIVGEEEELKSKRNFVKNKEHFTKNCAGALSILYENDEETAYNLVSQASRLIDKISDESLGELSEKLNEILYSIEDVVGDIRHQLDKINFDDMSLDEIEERLDIIYKLKRKYGDSEEAILTYCEKAQEELDNITFSDSKKAELEKKIKSLRDTAKDYALKLSEARKKNAKIIENEINSQLSELNMAGARFSVLFEETELGKKGIDKVEFLISTNQGEPEKPLIKIISGGELSRIMLAMKNVLTAGDSAGTLIFDEIDTGISGVTAGKVGVKLSEIAGKKQVICVTHLPQIAALSDDHFKISKVTDGDKTNTHIKSLSDEEKVEQIAYMISGDDASPTSIAQAKEMISKKR
ncbi:MAG: DNA repair protein RecN [Clostridia bacterium]|nr:DNA repair protein RecN [Clostridia bacterium]